MRIILHILITIFASVATSVVLLYLSGFSLYLKSLAKRSVTALKQLFTYKGQMTLIVLVIAVINYLFQHYLVEISAYLLSLNSGIESFMTITRGVVDNSNEFQDLDYKIVLMNFLLKPLIYFSGLIVLYKSLQFILLILKSKSGIDSSKMSLTTYFVVAVMFQMAINSALFTQSETLNRTIVILTLENLGYFSIAILTLVGIKRREILKYLSHPDIAINRIEKLILGYDITLIATAVVTYNVLVLPKNLGLQAVGTPTVSFLILLVSFVVIIYISRRFMLKNLLAILVEIIVIKDRDSQVKPLFVNPRVIKWLAVILTLILVYAAVIDFPKVAVVFWFGIATVISIGFVVLILGAIACFQSIGLLVRNKSTVKYPLFIWTRLFKLHFVSISAVVSPLIVVMLTCFNLYTIFPLSFSTYDAKISSVLIDERQELVYLDYTKQDHPAVKMPEADVFLNQMISAQEDMHFERRNNGWFHYNNFYGLNTTIFMGSNMINQIGKQLCFPDAKYPRTAIRKLIGISCGYIANNSYESEDLLDIYSTISAFGSNTGYRGAYLASYHLYQKPLKKLNKLEKLLLVETLKYGDGMKLEGVHISTTQFPQHKSEIRAYLVAKAENYWSAGLLDQSTYRRMRRMPLRISLWSKLASASSEKKQIFSPVISTGTREYLKNKKLLSGTTISSISVEGLSAASKADSIFKKEFARYTNKDGYKLLNLAFAINKSGQVISHWGDNVVSDYTTGGDGYGFTFPVASTNKPPYTALALNNGLDASEYLYDGRTNRWTPKNHDGYSNKWLSLENCIATSPNAPFFNMPEEVDKKEIIKEFEKILGLLGQYDGPFDQNIVLGYNNASIEAVTKLYNALIYNNSLSQLSHFSNEKNEKMQSVFKEVHSNSVKEMMVATIEYGTGKHLKKLLPAGQEFYSKSGTSNTNADAGWYVLASDDILIVSMVTYYDSSNLNNPFEDRPAIPFRSGAKTAGVFSSLFMNELLKLKL